MTGTSRWDLKHELRESTIIVAALALVTVAMSVVAVNSQRKQSSLSSPTEALGETVVGFPLRASS